jgi:hypothetical protein
VDSTPFRPESEEEETDAKSEFVEDEAREDAVVSENESNKKPVDENDDVVENNSDEADGE